MLTWIRKGLPIPVEIKVEKRQNKNITIIHGLVNYGIDLNFFAAYCSKKFASTCNVQKIELSSVCVYIFYLFFFFFFLSNNSWSELDFLSYFISNSSLWVYFSDLFIGQILLGSLGSRKETRRSGSHFDWPI